jgi:hypothetical protein
MMHPTTIYFMLKCGHAASWQIAPTFQHKIYYACEFQLLSLTPKIGSSSAVEKEK